MYIETISAFIYSDVDSAYYYSYYLPEAAQPSELSFN